MNRDNILALTNADVNGIDDSNLYESRLKLKPQLTRPAATRVVITHLFAQVYPEYLPSPLTELLLRQVSSVHTPSTAPNFTRSPLLLPSSFSSAFSYSRSRKITIIPLRQSPLHVLSVLGSFVEVGRASNDIETRLLHDFTWINHFLMSPYLVCSLP
ncbi:hypothetical protein BDR06DRAFT_951576 [Suillus hirtellus]|nr:hypothetical protein BDR06DRAFT_951576 [Suillus hirtellus]